MANKTPADERAAKLAEMLNAATDAYESGVRINDSMTFAEADLLNFGRRFSEATRRMHRAAVPTNVVDATSVFRGDRR